MEHFNFLSGFLLELHNDLRLVSLGGGFSVREAMILIYLVYTVWQRVKIFLRNDRQCRL